MIDFLKLFFKLKSLPISSSTIISMFVFLSNLGVAISDGVLTDAEFHQLMASASGFQMIILLIAMYFLHKK